MTINKKCIFLLPTLETGGAERVIITLANNIDVSNKMIISIGAGGSLASNISEGIRVVNLGYKRVRSAFFPLLKIIRMEQPDVVVSTITHMNFFIILLKPFFPKKTRLIVREATLPSYFLAKNRLKKIIARVGYKFLYPRADVVISPAQRIVDEFRDVFGLDVSKHIVLSNPVDVALLRLRANEEPLYVSKGRSGAVRYVAVARLNWAKGLDRLLEALPFLPANLDWELTILGEGEERARLEGIIQKHNLGDRVRLPGLVSNPWADLARADVCVLPSRWEGLPNVVLESLAVGTPVIATQEAGGIQDIADRSGNGVRVVNSMEDFISALSDIKTDQNGSVRPCLLPDEYVLSNVLTRFSQILR